MINYNYIVILATQSIMASGPTRTARFVRAKSSYLPARRGLAAPSRAASSPPPMQVFFDRFGARAVRGLSKYAALRQAILAAIDQGFWQRGTKLPSETEFVAATPFSLGTVQRA